VIANTNTKTKNMAKAKECIIQPLKINGDVLFVKKKIKA
jgi:hypothetical protein